MLQVKGFIVICGGLNENQNPTNRCSRFNGESGKWEDFANMNKNRAGAASTNFENKVVQLHKTFIFTVIRLEYYACC